MGRIEILAGSARKARSKAYEFTVVLLPVYGTGESVPRIAPKSTTKRVRIANPTKLLGYQVTVPSLPGVITFGRTQKEAESMAEDAIRCHIDGLKKDGEEIPSEATPQFRKLRISA